MLSHTVELSRSRRGSLPEANMSKSNGFKRNFQQPSTEIYFDKTKKSKFMKGIVDGYFNQELKNFLNQNKEQDDQEVSAINNSIKGLLKRRTTKFMVADKTSSRKSSPKKEKQEGKGKSQPLTFPQTQQLQTSPGPAPAHNFGAFLPPINETYDQSDDFAKEFPEFGHVSIEVPIKT